MKISEHIAAIRGLLQAHGEDVVPFSDQFIYTHFKAAAAYLMRQRFDRYLRVPESELSYFCIALEPGKVHVCDCIDVGCEVMKSTQKLPKPVSGKTRDYIYFYTLDHNSIPILPPATARGYRHDRVMKGRLSGSIIDDYAIVWNGNPAAGIPKAIMVATYPEDITEWNGIEACTPEGDPDGECFNLEEDNFPLEASLIDATYRRTLELIRPTLVIPKDEIND